MGTPDPSAGEWTCRRCGSIQEHSASVCTTCGTPSTATPERPTVSEREAPRRPFDWTTVLFVILIAVVIVALALAVRV